MHRLDDFAQKAGDVEVSFVDVNGKKQMMVIFDKSPDVRWQERLDESVVAENAPTM